MFITIRKWTALYVISLLMLVIGFTLIMQQGEAVQTSANTGTDALLTLIIDPGHGGEDGGAVAADGTVESHINLAIAKSTSDLAHLLGWNVMMTRTEDISIHSSDAQTLREKKVSDLKNRVAFCNGVDSSILISIHQNSLPSSPKTRGAQVFYSDTAGSAELAESIQQIFNKTINQKQIKEKKNIQGNYLMKHVTSPAVLVECGFLSNEDETRLLKSREYQVKIALAIISAATMHLVNNANCSGQ